MKRKHARAQKPVVAPALVVTRAPNRSDHQALEALIVFASATDLAAVVEPEARERWTTVAGSLLAEYVLQPASTAADVLVRNLGAAGLSDAVKGFHEMPRAHQQTAQESLRGLLDQIAGDGFVAWGPPDDQQAASVEGIGMVAGDGKGPERRLRRQGWFNGPAVFWMGVTELLERAAPSLLRRCTTCGSLFAKQKGQKYCAPPKKCSQQTRSAKWYAAHKREVLRRRHLAYVAQVKKLHPHAVVKRRPRLKASAVSNRKGRAGR